MAQHSGDIEASAVVANGNGQHQRTLQDVAVQLQAKVAAFLDEKPATPLLAAVQEQVRRSMDVIAEALARYSPEELSLSYNGGKDCLVLLVLLLASLPRRFPAPPLDKSLDKSSNDAATAPSQTTDTTSQSFPQHLQAVYVVSPHPFAEVDAFVDASAAEYHLDLSRYALPMREALAAYLADKNDDSHLEKKEECLEDESHSQNGHSNANGNGDAHKSEIRDRNGRRHVAAVFVGTRRTDPHGERLSAFDMTDAGWPSFMRVHPVVDWHYAEIWAFIRHLGIPYCNLYDLGYTSLGGTNDTNPNPALKNTAAADGEPAFRPAYELKEDDAERLGRDR